MKTVGKQLQEARLARNWTPELASRETKIKVDRLRDLEADDYSHFASPTYARGFVRTYARSLGLDEYRILRQLDNKLPDDDSSNIASETGVAYLPETAMPPRVAHRDYTGLYITMALGAVVTLVIAFVLFEAYRVGELSNWFASSPEPVTSGISGTNSTGTPGNPTTETIARALPVDSNTPPPIVDTTATTNATDTTNVTNVTDMTNATNGTNVIAEASPAAPGTLIAPRALPVDPSELTNAVPATPGSPPDAANVPPRALPVNPSDLSSADIPVAPIATTTAAVNTPLPASTPPPANETNAVSIPPVAPPAPSTTPAARQSNNGPVMEPSLPPVAPPAESAPDAPAAPTAPDATTNAAPPTAADSTKRLVLTASKDSFVRVTNLDASDTDKPLYADVLHSGQSIGFDGHKFSINVGIPSAVDIQLDGVNYGPHSDRQAPETFIVESHLP